MAFCCVKWCGKNSRTSNFKKDGITFHRFPKGPERKSKWIDATYRGDEWFPSKNSVICSRHFTEDSFHYMKDRRRVMETAVPSLYLPILGHFTNNRVDISTETNTANSVSDGLLSQSIPGSSSSQHEKVSSSKNLSSSPARTETSTKDINILPLPDTPSAYDCPTKKRMCRRILELKNTVRRKNRSLKNLRDCNKRLKKQIISLKSLLADIKRKILISQEN